MSRSSFGDAFDAWRWEGDDLVPDEPTLIDTAPNEAERCRSCGEWTSVAAGAFIPADDGLICPACKDDGLHLLNGEAP